MMRKYLPLLLRLIVAIILIQTLRFKFDSDPASVSVYIFSKVGLEPLGRIGIGVLEFIAGLLLLFKKTAWAGALLTLGIIGGAIIMHLTQLGIEVRGDGGVLFYTAIITFTLSLIVLYIYRGDIPFLVEKKIS